MMRARGKGRRGRDLTEECKYMFVCNGKERRRGGGIWGTYKWRNSLLDVLLHAECLLLLFYCPSSADNGGRLVHPLPYVGRYGPEAGRVGAGEFAHLGVGGFDAVVCHAGELGTCGAGLDDCDSVTKKRILVR